MVHAPSPTQASLERTANAVAEVAELRAALAEAESRLLVVTKQRDALFAQLEQIAQQLTALTDAVRRAM
jgi:hypothetical protein